VGAFGAAATAQVDAEVELAAVVEAVVRSAERDDAVGVVAATVGAPDHVHWVFKLSIADEHGRFATFWRWASEAWTSGSEMSGFRRSSLLLFFGR
jgi:hypothetical protein